MHKGTQAHQTGTQAHQKGTQAHQAQQKALTDSNADVLAAALAIIDTATEEWAHERTASGSSPTPSVG